MNQENTAVQKRIKSFAFIALLEGISYIVLLGIAMPLKYFADIPEAVKIVGWMHGVLFMLYFAFAFWTHLLRKWSFLMLVWIFFASLLPFGTFVLDRQLKAEIKTDLS